LTLGELLDRAFHLYRQHFLIFVGIVALPGLLPLAFNLLLAGMRDDPGFGLLLVILILWIVNLAALAVSQAATITAVSEVHLGRSISLGAALAAARGRIVEISVASIVLGLLIALGLLLLIVPGVLLALRWAVVIPVVVIERLPVRAAMERSSLLTDGFRGRAFLIYALYFLLSLIVGAIWQVPTGILVAMSGDADTGTAWLTMVSSIGSYVAQCLVGPLITVSLALYYYDQRVRKEAFDIDHMLTSLDQAPDPSSAAI
jgi:hypothetical protein